MPSLRIVLAGGLGAMPFAVFGVRLTGIDGAACEQRPPRRSGRAGFRTVALKQNEARRISLKYELDGAPLRVGEHQRPVENDVSEQAPCCAEGSHRPG